MRTWHLFAAAVLLSNACLAMNATLELHVLPNGHVRFDRGPELDDAHFAIKIRELMRQNPRPEIRILPNKQAKYDSVAAVLTAFQKAGYGPHFGFVGASN
jgi:biopolymer transport protein ExbD